MATPEQLVEQYKKSGAYDKARERLIAEFMESDDRKAVERKLDDLLPGLLSQPAHQHAKTNEIQVHLMRDVENRHPVLIKACADVERRLRAKERDRDGSISGELRPIMKASKAKGDER